MKCLYFDLDGPILDISPKFYKIYTDIFNEYGYRTLSIAEYWNLKKKKTPISDIVTQTAPAGFVDDYISKRLEVIEDVSYLKYDVIQPGIINILQTIKGKVPLVLVTLRNKRKNLDWELEHLQLADYFDEVLTEEENHGDYRIKVKLIQNYLAEKSPDGLIVGDTESDIKAGKQLGLVTVGVTCGIRTAEYLKELEPDNLIAEMPQLTEILKRELGI